MANLQLLQVSGAASLGLPGGCGQRALCYPQLSLVPGHSAWTALGPLSSLTGPWTLGLDSAGTPQLSLWSLDTQPGQRWVPQLSHWSLDSGTELSAGEHTFVSRLTAQFYFVSKAMSKGNNAHEYLLPMGQNTEKGRITRGKK